MDRDRELSGWIELSLVEGLGGQRLRALLEAFGSPRQILAASLEQLGRVVPAPIARRVLERDRGAEVERTLDWASRPGHRLLVLSDPDYPPLLREIADPPPLLYVVGDPRWLCAPAIAIVGSRNATPQGLENARRFARVLSDAGLTVVSGLALGVDSAAHRGGLEGRSATIAVLGTGADILYPQQNAALAAEIASHGALVSEFALGSGPLAGNFPRRNRIISGLARGCLVVEATLSSGSLITARCALEQGREVLAIPGSIHSPLARGCHALIKEGATLVESARDVLDALGVACAPASAATEPAAEDHPLLALVGFDPFDVDLLVARSGLAAEAVSAALLALELEGRIASLPGGLYQRTR